MNVLHLLNYPGNGGTEKYILMLAERLHKRECLFYTGYSMNGPMLEQLKRLDIDTFNIPMSGPFDLSAAGHVARLCLELSIDVVHTHFLRENYISILSKLFGNRARLINTNHIIARKSVLHILADRLLTVLDDRIVAVCYAGKERLAAGGIDPGRIEVIHNGVDVDYWASGYNSTIRDELGIDGNVFVVVSIARFSEEKGHMFLLDAVKRILEINRGSSRPFRFILAGEGAMLDRCRNHAAKLEDPQAVIFTGYRTDIRNILHGSNLYVSSSRSEALSISVIEALASGLPVVATDAGGTSEILDAGNNCGILVKYGDVDGFARAILKMAQDSEFYDICRRNALNTARTRFSLDRTTLETLNLYRGGNKQRILSNV